MKKVFVITFLLVAAIAGAEFFTPMNFNQYYPKAAVARHTVTSGATKVAITSSVATFFNYTGFTAPVKKYPIAANTMYVFNAVPGTRIAFQNISAVVYVSEQK